MKEETARKYVVMVCSEKPGFIRDNGLELLIRAYTAEDALVQVKTRPDFVSRGWKILDIRPE